ncbi:MAG: hypothetical protein AABX70_01835 [Nanoarchaeota archaeon]
MAEKAVAKTVTKAVTKIIRKRWVPILAPKLFHERVIGESYVAEPEQLRGRSVFVNMMVLTGDPKKQQVQVQFSISDVKEGKGYATFKGYAYSPNSIKRLARRGRDKIDDSFLCKTQDNVVLRVKPIIVTGSKAPRSVQGALRRTFRRKMKEIVQKETFEQVMRDILEYKLQGAIKGLLHKFFPVRVLDIRVLKIEPVEYTEKESLTVEIPKKKEEGVSDEEVEEKVEEESQATEEESMEETEEESPQEKKSKKKASE